MINPNEKNKIKEREENEVLLIITKATICLGIAGIIYGIYKFCKLKEEKENLENQVKMQEMIIKGKINQLISIVSKTEPVTNLSSWQRLKECSKEIWEGSEITKKTLWKTRETFSKKN